MPKTRLLLIRHGETDDNHRRIFQGQAGRGLNARGRDQSIRLAARFEQLGLRAQALYCSDLDRARETAELLSGALGVAPIAEPRLREVHVGEWQGLGYDDIAARYPDEWDAWRRGVDFKRGGGGETYAEVGDRVAAAVDSIAAAHAGETAVIVSHGAAIKVFVGKVLGLDTSALRRYRVAANTGVTLVEREGGVDTLAIWNDASHLEDPLSELRSPEAI
ncbi:MAG: histidine phosphatase family protein [Byssovorax sp.]